MVTFQKSKTFVEMLIASAVISRFFWNFEAVGNCTNTIHKPLIRSTIRTYGSNVLLFFASVMDKWFFRQNLKRNAHYFSWTALYRKHCLTFINEYFDLYHSVQLLVVVDLNNDRLSVLAEWTRLVMKEPNQEERPDVILGSVLDGILGDGLR